MSNSPEYLREAIMQMIHDEESLADEELVFPYENNNSYIEINFINDEDNEFTVRWDYNIASIGDDNDEKCFDSIEDACSCVVQVFQAWHDGVTELWGINEKMETRLMKLIPKGG